VVFGGGLSEHFGRPVGGTVVHDDYFLIDVEGENPGEDFAHGLLFVVNGYDNRQLHRG
jgi:hypothetical protein